MFDSMPFLLATCKNTRFLLHRQEDSHSSPGLKPWGFLLNFENYCWHQFALLLFKRISIDFYFDIYCLRLFFEELGQC